MNFINVVIKHSSPSLWLRYASKSYYINLYPTMFKLVGLLVDNDALCVSSSISSATKFLLESVIAYCFSSFTTPICHHSTVQLFEPVATSEVFKMFSSIPSKTSVLDFFPTSVLESRLVIYLVQPLLRLLEQSSFGQGGYTDVSLWRNLIL